MISNFRKAVLITSGQPSTNPRLVKEADFLYSKGIDVTVIYQYWSKWATEADIELLRSKKWKYIKVGGDPETEKLEYWKSRIAHKAFRIIYQYSGIKYFAKYNLSRNSFLLIYKAKKIKADLYIGHNLGALPAVVIAAKFNKAICGFDAEDFHRFESSDSLNNFEVQQKIYIEESFFPRLNFLITSSPLINYEYNNLFPNLNSYMILNVFEDLHFDEIKCSRTPLKLFWFSQTIGLDRGLDDIFKALGMISHLDIQIHLLGEIDEAKKSKILNIVKGYGMNSEMITFYSPIASDLIPHFAKTFDIGLATETGIPFNREVCLTNKLFTYMQAGLAIMASDTKSHTQLLQIEEKFGFIYKRGDIKGIAVLLNRCYNDLNLVNNQKTLSFNLFKNKFNWEIESRKYLKIISEN